MLELEICLAQHISIEESKERKKGETLRKRGYAIRKK
jgi:hypothetical protein